MKEGGGEIPCCNGRSIKYLNNQITSNLARLSQWRKLCMGHDMSKIALASCSLPKTGSNPFADWHIYLPYISYSLIYY
jgi:hypothetical protein